MTVRGRWKLRLTFEIESESDRPRRIDTILYSQSDLSRWASPAHLSVPDKISLRTQESWQGTESQARRIADDLAP